MILDVLNKKKEKVETIEVSDIVFSAPWRPNLVKDVIVAYEANARKPYAHTKDRSEVRGGGKKPWKQKHTGRARHGSSRSPIWTGGGVTFGPRNDKDYSKKINKKAKKAALYSIISKKMEEKEVFVLDDFLFGPKTKNVGIFISSFFGKRKKVSALFIRSKESEDFVISSKNIQGIDVVSIDSLNPYVCAVYKFIIFEKAVVGKLS